MAPRKAKAKKAKRAVKAKARKPVIAKKAVTSKRRVKRKAAKPAKKAGASRRQTPVAETISLKDVIRQAVHLAARRRDALATATGGKKPSGAGEVSIARTQVRVVLRRYRTQMGPHSSGEDDSDVLPSGDAANLVGGPHGRGDKEGD